MRSVIHRIPLGAPSLKMKSMRTRFKLATNYQFIYGTVNTNTVMHKSHAGLMVTTK
jgi:hypothetical protein